MAKASPRSSASAQPADAVSGHDVAQDLSFREAQTALELCLAQLQDQDLDVEAMADLYRRALAYAERCEAVLARVEQQVMQWDPGQPELAPTPYTP
jgi:exodeoxyribonuclease VII small subunit